MKFLFYVLAIASIIGSLFHAINSNFDPAIWMGVMASIALAAAAHIED